MKNKRNGVFEAVAVVTAFSVATRLLSFLFKIYVSRTLGAEAVGLYQMALSVYLLTCSFAASGLPVVLSRKIAADSATDGNRSNGYLTSAVIICLSVSAVILVLYYTFNNLLSGLFADKRAARLLMIMLPALLSTSLYVSIRSWFWGKKQFPSFGFSETLEEIFRIIFTIIFTCGIVTVISPLDGLAVGFVLSDAACVITIIIIFIKNKGRFTKPYGAKELLNASLPITAMKAFGGVVTSISALIIPAMLVRTGLSTGDATATFGRMMGMAMPLLMAPMTLTGSLAVVLIPEIAEAKAHKNDDYLKRRIEGSIVFSVFIASFFCILFLPLGKETAEIVFNDSVAGEFLSNSAILLYPLGLNQITLSMLNSLGLEKKSFMHYLIGTTLLIISLFVLPRYVGAYAVAIGIGLCFTITSVLNLRLLNKKTELFNSPEKLVMTICFMPPCAAIAFLLKYLLMPLLPQFIAVVISGGVPMLIYLVLATSFKIIDVSRFYHRRKRKA